MAQSLPNGILFQAVAKDASGNAAASRTIYATVDIHQKTASGLSVYTETHQVMSNDDGIFTLIVGNGVRTAGAASFDNLSWRSEIYFINLKIAIAPSLPTPGWDLSKEYVDMGTSQIWAVPYAFSAFKAVIADSATTIAGILAGTNGGTGVSNPGKTITLGRNFELQGLGNLKFNTVGPTSLNLPVKGTLVTSESLDTLINKYLLSPTFLGTPKTPTVDTVSNDSSVASTKFVKSVISSQISALSNTLNNTIDTSSGSKLKISDTLTMLSNRIERDTASLSKRINLKVNTLNAKIDSSLYVNGKVTIDSIVAINDALIVKGNARFDSLLTINDSLRVKGNVLIDTNLTVGKNLEIKGNLILNKGLDFNDSLVVQKGARIEQSILAKSKLYVSDSILAKGNLKIDSNLTVKKVTSLNDSLYVKGQARFDSLLTINDSLRVKGNVLIDTNLTVGKDLEVKGNLILNSGLQFNDSLIVTKGARIEQSILAKSKLYVSDSILAQGNVKIDKNLNVNKVTSLNDSLYVKGQARFDSLLTINDSLRVKGNVLIDSNLTVLGKLSLNTALQFNDSLIVTKGARIDQSILAKSKLYVSDSILAKGNVKIDSNLYVKGQGRFDSILTINDSLRVKGNVLIDSNLTVMKVTSLNDSLYVKGKARFDSLLTINDSLRVKGNVLIDSNLTVNKITTLNDSLIVKSGARIDQNILAKSKLTVTDSLLAKGNVKIDNNLLVKGLNINDSITKFSWSKLNVADTSNMLYDYLRKINDLYSSINIANGSIANKLFISDTSFLLQKRDTSTLSNRINLKLNISDTSSMLSNRIQRDTISLSRRINNLVTGAGDLATLKLNILDTSYLVAKRDTAAMLQSRFKRDTAFLSHRLDLLEQATLVNNGLKLNITDTSYLLQKKDTITLSNRIDALAQSSNLFTTDITINMGAGKTFGRFSNLDVIQSKGKSIDEVIKDIVTLVIHPTYTRPTAGLSMGSSGDFEIGTNLGTLTYSPNFTQNDGGNFTSISYIKNGVEITSNTGSPSVTDNVGTLSATTNYQVAYTYGAGTTVKKNNIGADDAVGQITASIVNSGIITLTPRSYRYWGMTTNSSASITDADIRAMSGGSMEFSSSKLKSEFTIKGSGGSGPVKYAFYAVPSGNSGTISSIKAGGFESIAAFDVITRDFVNAQGYKISYDIYVQKNSGTDNVTLIIN
jgi:hypothetical protein